MSMDFFAGFLIGFLVAVFLIAFVIWFLHEAHKPPVDPRYS